MCLLFISFLCVLLCIYTYKKDIFHKNNDNTIGETKKNIWKLAFAWWKRIYTWIKCDYTLYDYIYYRYVHILRNIQWAQLLEKWNLFDSFIDQLIAFQINYSKSKRDNSIVTHTEVIPFRFIPQTKQNTKRIWKKWQQNNRHSKRDKIK